MRRRAFNNISSNTAATPPAFRCSINRLHLLGPARINTWPRDFPIGMRFHSAPVVRLADGKPMHLGHVQQADARWLLLAFAPRDDPMGALTALCAELGSLVQRPTPKDHDIDSRIDLRAVLQGSHHDVNITDLPALLFPQKGLLDLRDYEKVFCPDPARGDIFDLRSINRTSGCLVMIRPDQYVANIFPFDALEDLSTLLGRTCE